MEGRTSEGWTDGAAFHLMAADGIDRANRWAHDALAVAKGQLDHAI